MNQIIIRSEIDKAKILREIINKIIKKLLKIFLFKIIKI